ncbi:MAG: ABC transporter ATP-binding protein [Acidobacteriota bacterium]
MSSTHSKPILAIRDLHKSYGAKEILKGVDFDLFAGETLVILGFSGTGKSVTLRQINGLEKPDQGQVFFDGIEVTSLSERQLYPIRRRVSMLFQGGALFDSMNVLDNVAFPLREHTDHDSDEIAEIVRQKLSLVRLENVEHMMPSDLSGGMRKRVALARSLALDPELMLYDEPTTGLDPVTSAAIGELIHGAQRDLCVSAVVVTHDLPLARTVANKVAFLYEGRFRFLGTWEEAESAQDVQLRCFLEGRPAPEVEHAA